MCIRNYFFKVEVPKLELVAYFSDLSRLQNAFNIPVEEISKYYHSLYNSPFNPAGFDRFKVGDVELLVSYLPIDYIREYEFRKISSLTEKKTKK